MSLLPGGDERCDGIVDGLGHYPPLAPAAVLNLNLLARSFRLSSRHTLTLADRPVEAGMCLRAIERLDEAEAKIVRLRSQVRDALSVGETQEATRCQLAMSDIRDAVFRVAQIDLLLNRHDLRAVGIISKWATE
ncbi:Uncharacterized protein C40H1.3 [Toxocara canis]|uniref:Uncharacterized protein C40H1.3 n=1 Tax=Toxocara canis TaxID=6265 RepID=A0A0B2VCX2_TOXCA|nr:Uncharacterized protein C40H1.3 [Toxocara canis]